MKQNRNLIPDEVQLQIVQEYISTDITVVQLQEKYGFRGNSNIPRWMRKFGINFPNDPNRTLEPAMVKKSDKTPRERELEAKIKLLEKELDKEKLRTLVLDKMIEIAERDLKIPIRKKSGPKR